jgi:hypothetical protein
MMTADRNRRVIAARELDHMGNASEGGGDGSIPQVQEHN